jgi:hypothetical protein
MGRTGKTHLLVKAGPSVADASSLRQQRPLHLLPNRDLLSALRQLKLRLRGSVERPNGSTMFLVSNKSTTSHHRERINKGRATLNLFVPPATALTKGAPTRGQSRSGGCTQLPYVPVTCHDWQASETMGTHRHQQYQHLRTLYSIRGQRMDRHTHPRNRQTVMAAQPLHIHLLGLTVAPPLHQQVCHARQHNPPATMQQCPLARPNRRSRGLPTTPRHFEPRRPTSATHIGRSFPTSSASYANLSPKQHSSRHIVVPATERTIRRANIVPPSEICAFKASAERTRA